PTHSGSPLSRGNLMVGASPTQRGSPLSRGNLKAGVQQDELYEACQQFEAVFLLHLWRAMQRTIPQRRQTLNYAEMFDLTFAEYLARYGQFGIAERLYERFSMPDELGVKNDARP
ncbi:MAG: hypothetical protein NZL85_02100, partial [Fimbriimonadales bacterium]|nr:hypothetical protein [Fimbriimonadales bacterium]